MLFNSILTQWRLEKSLHILINFLCNRLVLWLAYDWFLSKFAPSLWKPTRPTIILFLRYFI